MDERGSEIEYSPECRSRQEEREGQPQLVSNKRRFTGFDKEKYGRRGGENNKTTEFRNFYMLAHGSSSPSSQVESISG